MTSLLTPWLPTTMPSCRAVRVALDCPCAPGGWEERGKIRSKIDMAKTEKDVMPEPYRKKPCGTQPDAYLSRTYIYITWNPTGLFSEMARAPTTNCPSNKQRPSSVPTCATSYARRFAASSQQQHPNAHIEATSRGFEYFVFMDFNK